MARKTKRTYKRPRFPVVGKYIDTPTQAELEVIYFVDNVGNYRLTIGDLPPVYLSSCRFQLRNSNVRAKKKFSKMLQPFLDLSSGFKELDRPESEIEVPLLFGLLKIRKGKTRKLVWIRSADQYFKGKIINVIAVIIDNLLYMDLMSHLKNKKKA